MEENSNTLKVVQISCLKPYKQTICIAIYHKLHIMMQLHTYILGILIFYNNRYFLLTALVYLQRDTEHRKCHGELRCTIQYRQKHTQRRNKYLTKINMKTIFTGENITATTYCTIPQTILYSIQQLWILRIVTTVYKLTLIYNKAFTTTFTYILTMLFVNSLV